MLEIAIPGRETIRARHLLLDINGTLTTDGELLPGVSERIEALKTHLAMSLLTADIRGTARSLGKALAVRVTVLEGEDGGAQKQALVRGMIPATVIAIGNGDNDAGMVEAAALGIVVLKAEGAAVSALLQADVVYPSIHDARDALLTPTRLIATLRR